MSITTAYATPKTGLSSQLNSQPVADPYASAVDDWNQGQEKIFDFCEKAAGIVGNYEEGKTAQLAKRIGRSATTVQNYAKAGKLWRAFLQQYPRGEDAGNEKYLSAEEYRDHLQVSYWISLGRQWANNEMSLGGVREWFQLAIKEKLNVDQFRSRLPTSGGRSEYSRTVRQLEIRVNNLMVDIDHAMTSPAFDVDVEKYKEFYALLKQVKELAPLVMRKDAT